MLGEPEARGLGESGGDTQLSPSDRSPSCGGISGSQGTQEPKGGVASTASAPKTRDSNGHFPGWIGGREAGTARAQGRESAETWEAVGGNPGFSGRGIKAKLVVSEHWTRVVWDRPPRGGPGTRHRPSGVQVTSRGCDSFGLWTASFIYFCAEP